MKINCKLSELYSSRVTLFNLFKKNTLDLLSLHDLNEYNVSFKIRAFLFYFLAYVNIFIKELPSLT